MHRLLFKYSCTIRENGAMCGISVTLWCNAWCAGRCNSAGSHWSCVVIARRHGTLLILSRWRCRSRVVHI